MSTANEIEYIDGEASLDAAERIVGDRYIDVDDPCPYHCFEAGWLACIEWQRKRDEAFAAKERELREERGAQQLGKAMQKEGERLKGYE